VSIAFALAVCVIFWYPTWRLAGSLIDLSFSQAMLNLRGPFICALLMALGVLALRLALGAALPPAMRLSVSVLVGACVYIGAIQIANVPAYMLIKGRVVGKVYQTFRR
jgi:hypothetical protein